MAPRHNALLNAEDYRSLPEDGLRYELIQGELQMAPAPSSFHQTISCNLVYLLRQYLEGVDGNAGRLFHAPIDVYLSEHDVLQPDLVLIETDRVALIRPDGIRGAPTLVIEILSPSTRTLDRTTKKGIYQAAGVKELWLVDPERKEVEVHRLQDQTEVSTFGLDRASGLTSSCLPGLILDCQRIFI